MAAHHVDPLRHRRAHAETISTGEVLVNRVRLHGLGRPLTYMHSLIGWEANGRRAVLSCVQL
ncbi:hypothetical protein [Azospirillum sp. TSO22-1]|uniref:hypothetical protein n=1 Tax=Azospirillum sp. TSO22-1 TaxID=716789 RepID=UPI0018EE6794|nr:hypothetical protein [Azospirillum sp. TSO22-1]